MAPCFLTRWIGGELFCLCVCRRWLWVVKTITNSQRTTNHHSSCPILWQSGGNAVENRLWKTCLRLEILQWWFSKCIWASLRRWGNKCSFIPVPNYLQWIVILCWDKGCILLLSQNLPAQDLQSTWWADFALRWSKEFRNLYQIHYSGCFIRCVVGLGG